MTSMTDIRYIRCYTDGSSAIKLAGVQTEKTAPRTVKKKRKPCRVIYMDPVATFGIVIAVIMLGAMVLGLVQAKAARAQLNAMDAYVSQLSEDNKALKEKYADSYDLDTVRQTALAMGMVPRQEVEQISLENIRETIPEEPDFFSRLGTFLSGLFA